MGSDLRHGMPDCASPRPGPQSAAMQVVRTRQELAAVRASLPGPVGLVPTMGALHAGHQALAAAARTACAAVVASIFVNPSQFSDAAAASAYPRDEETDLGKLAAAGCDAVWLPAVSDIYPGDQVTTIDPAGPALQWEGTHRPGHFRGMATVVAKLLGLVRPDTAFFGEKDWQQLQVVRHMVADLVLPVGIVGVATVREADGLAMSSRNRFLDGQQRVVAPRLQACLRQAAQALHAGVAAETALGDGRARLEAAGFTVNYFALVDGATLRPAAALPGSRLIAAAQLGPVRLLDNIGV